MSFCRGDHHWKKMARGIRLLCEICPATFPCRVDCSHLDCEETYGKTLKCETCKKPVAFSDGFHISYRGRLFRFCPGECVEKFEQANQEEIVCPSPEDSPAA